MALSLAEVLEPLDRTCELAEGDCGCGSGGAGGAGLGCALDALRRAEDLEPLELFSTLVGGAGAGAGVGASGSSGLNRRRFADVFGSVRMAGPGGAISGDASAAGRINPKESSATSWRLSTVINCCQHQHQYQYSIGAGINCYIG